MFLAFALDFTPIASVEANRRIPATPRQRARSWGRGSQSWAIPRAAAQRAGIQAYPLKRKFELEPEVELEVEQETHRQAPLLCPGTPPVISSATAAGSGDGVGGAG
jgi:hypothetical protein